VTRGSAMYFFNFSVTDSANCIGVRPAACTSSSNGIEIFPSGRTGSVAVRSGSFHTLMCSVSSAPITYDVEFDSCVACPFGGAGGFDFSFVPAVLSACPQALPPVKTTAKTIPRPIFLLMFSFSPALGCSVFPVANLFQLVQQSLVADL